MIRLRLLSVWVLLPIILGMVLGYYLEGLMDTEIHYHGVYETVANGYLSSDVDALELVAMLEDLSKTYPDVVKNILAELQKSEIILKVPAGGKFAILQTVKSNLSPKHLYIKIKAIDGKTPFWVFAKSINKIKKGDDK